MSHDLHHGGQLALMLGLQGIDVPELGDKGGHLTPWSLVKQDTYGAIRSAERIQESFVHENRRR